MSKLTFGVLKQVPRGTHIRHSRNGNPQAAVVGILLEPFPGYPGVDRDAASTADAVNSGLDGGTR
jgi:hypothetical protein